MYLNCKTYFSFRYGTIGTKALVSLAAARGITSLALTNINSTCDNWDFVAYCEEAGIKPITGVEIRNDDECCFILLAASNRGLSWIHRFLSDHLMNERPFPTHAKEHPFFHDTWDGFVIYPIGRKQPEELFPNERIGVRLSERNKLFVLATNCCNL